MKNTTRDVEKISVKTILLYFLKIQLCILITLFISIPLITLIRFFTDVRVVQDLILGILGVVIEFFTLLFMFSKEKVNDRSLKCSYMIKNTSLALIPHFVLSLCFQFYIYVAGTGVSQLGCVWGSHLAGKYLEDQRDVPFYTFVVLMIPMMALIVLSSYLGYMRGNNIIQKNRSDFFKK